MIEGRKDNEMINSGKPTINYDTVRSNRKTVVITISAAGLITVKAPLLLTDHEIHRLVQTKAGWIEKKLLMMEQNQVIRATKRYTDNEKFLFQGNEYRLCVRQHNISQKTVVKLVEDQLVISIDDISPVAVKKAIESWYQIQAKQKIPERVHEYLDLIGESVETIRVKNHQKRWGSCSSKRNLNFNWRLIMAPQSILDYVIVHELCHLKLMNHSVNFWNYVAEILPDYRDRRRWLKENGMQFYL